MANTTCKLYIRNKVGYRKPPKKLADLPEGETFVLFWYEGKAKKAKAVGRFADEAQTALINKEAALRRTSLTGAVPAPAPEPEKVVTSGRDFTEALNQYLSEVKRGKSKKAHLARNITLDGFSKVCKARTIEAMSRADVLKYTDLLRGSGLTPRTIANRLAFLKTSFKHFNLAWPMLKTDRVKFTEKTVEAYSLEELKSLFAAANQEEFELLQFLLGTGVREPRRAHRAGVYGRSADEAGTREGSSAYDRGGNADLEEAAGSSPDLAEPLYFLAKAYVETGRFADGEKIAKELVAVQEGKVGPTDRRFGASHLIWARALAGQHRYDEALPHAELADGLLANAVSPGGKQMGAEAHQLLAEIQSKIQK